MKYSRDDLVLVVTDTAEPDTVRTYKVLRHEKGVVYCEGKANIFDEAFVYPIAVQDELLRIVQERKRLKKEFENSLDLIFQLRNKIARGEL